MGIEERYMRELEQLRECCRAAGRDPQEVTLIAVSKTVGPEGAGEAFAAGCRDFGENRPDEIMRKHAAYPEARWHFIGNIQSRRIKDIVACAALIHSLYQYSHAQKIDEAARACGKVQDVLIEVNVSGEKSKSGVTADEAFELVRACNELPCVRVRGLMTMAPQGNAAVARKTFEDLASLRDDIRSKLAADDALLFDGLSMGMSEDWREAVYAGATMVRIGRAVFSDAFE